MIETKEIKKFVCDWCGATTHVTSFRMVEYVFDGYDRNVATSSHIELCEVCQDKAIKLLREHGGMKDVGEAACRAVGEG